MTNRIEEINKKVRGGKKLRFINILSTYDALAVLHPRNDAYVKTMQLSTSVHARGDTREDIM